MLSSKIFTGGVFQAEKSGLRAEGERSRHCALPADPFNASNQTISQPKTCVRNQESLSKRERGCMGWIFKIVTLLIPFKAN